MSKLYKIKLPNFEGPLDLLLYLIRKHKIDIYDIPISFILKEYLEHLSLMEELNIAIEGEFMEMVATLMQIKLRSLLPKRHDEEEEAEDPRTELVKNLLAYKKMRESAELLENLAEENSRYFYPPLDKHFKQEIQNNATSYNIDRDEGNVFDLIQALQKHLLLKPQEIPETVDLEEYKIEDKMEIIEKLLEKQEKIIFSKLIQNTNRLETITVFMAILEMIKRSFITIYQSKEFSEIHIRKRK